MNAILITYSIDSRLEFPVRDNGPNPITLTGDELNDVWLPDTFFRNTRSVDFHNALDTNAYIRISPDGEIKTSQRITLDLSCPNLKKDLTNNGAATCHMDVASCKLKKTKSINFYLCFSC